MTNYYLDNNPPIKGQAWDLEFVLLDLNDPPNFKTNPTFAVGDIMISQDGGAFENTVNLPVEIGNSGVLTLALTENEMDANRIAILCEDQSGDEWGQCLLLLSTISIGIVVDPLDESEIASAVLDAVAASYNDPGSIGEAINSSGAGSGGASAAEVWGYAARTLTQTAAQVEEALGGTTLNLYRDSTFTAALTGLGNLVERDKLYFTVKGKLADADAAALIQIEESGGLLRLNGVEAAAGDGSLTVDNEMLGNVTLRLEAAAAAKLVIAGGQFYDLKLIDSGEARPLTAGRLNVFATATRSIA